MRANGPDRRDLLKLMAAPLMVAAQNATARAAAMIEAEPTAHIKLEVEAPDGRVVRLGHVVHPDNWRTRVTWIDDNLTYWTRQGLQDWSLKGFDILFLRSPRAEDVAPAYYVRMWTAVPKDEPLFANPLSLEDGTPSVKFRAEVKRADGSVRRFGHVVQAGNWRSRMNWVRENITYWTRMSFGDWAITGYDELRARVPGAVTATRGYYGVQVA